MSTFVFIRPGQDSVAEPQRSQEQLMDLHIGESGPATWAAPVMTMSRLDVLWATFVL